MDNATAAQLTGHLDADDRRDLLMVLAEEFDYRVIEQVSPPDPTDPMGMATYNDVTYYISTGKPKPPDAPATTARAAFQAYFRDLSDMGESLHDTLVRVLGVRHDTALTVLEKLDMAPSTLDDLATELHDVVKHHACRTTCYDGPRYKTADNYMGTGWPLGTTCWYAICRHRGQYHRATGSTPEAVYRDAIAWFRMQLQAQAPVDRGPVKMAHPGPDNPLTRVCFRCGEQEKDGKGCGCGQLRPQTPPFNENMK